MKPLIISFIFLLNSTCLTTSDNSINMSKISKSKSTKKLTSGTYSGETVGYVGMLILEVSDSSHSNFKNIVSTHLPPTELENIWLNHFYSKGNEIRISPEPTSIKPFIIIMSPDTLKVIQKHNDAEIFLIKQP